MREAEARPAEVKLYEFMWANPDYRRVSPGENAAGMFLHQAGPPRGASVIDYGCGTGRGGAMLYMLNHMHVTFVDFAYNCLDEEVHALIEANPHCLQFRKGDLTKPLDVVNAEYGFCTDVMEHIPTDDVDRVLMNILGSSRHVFFQICLVEDFFYSEIAGHQLHLTVRDYTWWLEKFISLNCMIHWSQDDTTNAAFFVTGHAEQRRMYKLPFESPFTQILSKNVPTNIQKGYRQITPKDVNEKEVILLGGGPSLKDQEATIRRMIFAGAQLACMNNSFAWCLERGIVPDAVIVCDPSPYCAAFTHPENPFQWPLKNVDYLLASQCDPSVFEGLPYDQTHIWHSAYEEMEPHLKEYYGGRYFPVHGGSTVLLRAIPLLRMLGYRSLHLFGCDSCLDGRLHHAYDQSKNDGDEDMVVTEGGKEFHCYPWMLVQAHDFVGLLNFMGHTVRVNIHGGGLLDAMINHKAM